MATRYEVAFGIKKSVEVPTDLVPFQFGYFEQHQRHNDELGEYTIYHADTISYGHVLDISTWLRGLDVDDYQFVSYSAENEHDIESFGNERSEEHTSELQSH